MTAPLFHYETNVSLFGLNTKCTSYSNSYSFKTRYNGGDYLLQTPWLLCPYGITDYATDNHSGNIPKTQIVSVDTESKKLYNIVRFRDETGERSTVVQKRFSIAFNPTGDFLEFIQRLDQHFNMIASSLGLKYKPMLLVRPEREPQMRAGVLPRHVKNWEHFKDKRMKCMFVLRMMPMWVRNGCAGVTFRVLNISGHSVEFRDN